LLDLLLAGVTEGDLIGVPVHPVGEQDRAAQPVIHQLLPGSVIEIKLQSPAAILGLQLVADQLIQESP